MYSSAFKINAKRIRDYLYHTVNEDGYGFIVPRGATNIKVHKLSKLSMGIHDTYAFSMIYFCKGKELTSRLILKFYGQDERKCQEEYRILKALEHVNFPVPHACIQEKDEKFFGSPFVIMEKVEGKTMKDYVKHLGEEETLDIIRRFAENLALLHNLNWEEMGLDFLRPPKDEYDYAKKQALWMDELPDFVKKQNFDWATKWLEANALKCPCNQYSLLRIDLNPRNFLVTKEGRIIWCDWEWHEIGDALKDVGYAYHSIRHMFGVGNINKKGAKLGSYFLREYVKSSGRKIDPFSLRFYIFSAGLREAIYLRYLSEKCARTPCFVIKTFGFRYLPLFPFVSRHFRNRYKHLERFLKQEAMDYEEQMFGTPGGKILSSMEIKNILRFLDAKPLELILDIGTGSGRIAREVVSKTKANVIGIDVGHSTIESAKIRRGNLNGYELVVADGQHLPFEDDSFDAIICIRALKYFPDYISGISEMSRILKPSKRVIIDLSSPIGYEIVPRYITHKTSGRVFNFYKMRKLLRRQKLSIVDALPLQKIPHKVWDLSTNPIILQFLIVGENVLRKITPLIFSRSILLKCIKDYART